MIYLIDEKKKRQENYHWDENRFESYKNILTPIYSVEGIRKDLLSDENVILFHESFFDDPKNKYQDRSESLKQKILTIDTGAKRVFFSGSKSNRFIKDDSYASMHVSWVYKNLEYFLNQTIEGDVDLKYLAYGINYTYEQISSIRETIWRALYLQDNDSVVRLGPQHKEELDSLLQILDLQSRASELKDPNIKVGYFKFLFNETIKSKLDE